jgi:hypothetical protein
MSDQVERAAQQCGVPAATSTPSRRLPEGLGAFASRRPVQFPLVINRQPVQYKGDNLDAERGPGLGCFRFQLVVLVAFIVLTPLTVAWGWPTWISAALLFAVIILLLVAGQTIIFLLRLVAADRRSRRRPLASGSKTVGQLEDERAAGTVVGSSTAPDSGASTPPTTIPGAGDPDPSSEEGPVRQ